MSVVPLIWNDSEGYDIHVLRKGPPSKALDKSFTLDPQFTDPLVFTPHFKGAPSAQGVTVDTTTGAVTASAPPDPTYKLRNFLITASQNRGPDTAQTLIRIHLHESIQKIWLTPSSLTIHLDANECRFTVLAQFDDDTVGDITDWPQLTYTSSNQFSVEVLNTGDKTHGGEVTEIIGGRLLAKPPGDFPVDPPEITVTLPSANLSSSTAKVFVRPSWTDIAKDPNTKITWLAGPYRPNENDFRSSKPNCIASVFERANILFVSEGFPQSQSQDFDKAVQSIVNAWRSASADFLQPFPLLKDSINYWSVFVPSQEDGISLLGDYEINQSRQRGSRLLRPEEPPPGSTEWSVENMTHQLGLPVPKDPPESLPDAITRWNKLYVTQVTDSLVKSNFSEWNALRSRSPLNERDSAFGFAIKTRARVSDVAGGDPLLRPAPRRTSEASIDLFTTNLQFSGFWQFGNLWDQGAMDRGRVCFVCLSDVGAGEARSGYFAASTGYEKGASVITVTNGFDIKTVALSGPKPPYSPDILASRAVHECGHALGLGDEYGPGNGAFFTVGVSAIPSFPPNLQTKWAITSTTTTSSGSQTVYDPDKIRWLLPRAIKVGLMDKAAPVVLGGSDFQMNMASGQGKQFVKGDLVLMRRPLGEKDPNTGLWIKRPLSDPFTDLRFTVIDPHPDWIKVTQIKGGTLDVTLYDPAEVHVLICVSSSAKPGVELKLIADPILNWIRTSGGPLNAPKDKPDAACVAANNNVDSMTPTNVPKLKFKRSPPAPADIIGIYEGGFHFDCGIFRPAGRCIMRTSDQLITTKEKVIPFCQVCRYLIVDRVDATKLADLDKMYDPNYPT
jgi:hypothetical protein